MTLDEFEQSVSEPKLEVYITHTPWSDVKKCRLEGQEMNTVKLDPAQECDDGFCHVIYCPRCNPRGEPPAYEGWIYTIPPDDRDIRQLRAQAGLGWVDRVIDSLPTKEPA